MSKKFGRAPGETMGCPLKGKNKLKYINIWGAGLTCLYPSVCVGVWVCVCVCGGVGVCVCVWVGGGRTIANTQYLPVLLFS